MKKNISLLMCFILIMSILGGCSDEAINAVNTQTQVKAMDFNFDVNPETFEVTIESDGVKEKASEGLQKREVSNLKKSKDKISWKYPNENIDIELKKEKEYLSVKIKSNEVENSQFQWPTVHAKSYTIPIHEGKYIPSNNKYWKEFLNNESYTVAESFSMQFFALNKKRYSIVYVIENMFNNEITFDSKEDIKFTFKHEFPTINKNKEYGFKIYVTNKNTIDIAKTYKNYVVEKGKFKTLEEKAKMNKNIEKLYGAIHMYFWDKSVVSQENIKWNEFRKNTSVETMNWIKKLMKENIENGNEVIKVFDDIKNQDYVDEYQKKVIIRALNEVLLLKEFYNIKVFTNIDEKTKKLLNKGLDNLNPLEIINLNKRVLQYNMKNIFEPVENWANTRNIDLLEDINKSGIKNAWIGFEDWRQGYIKPELVEKANEMEYLIGTYDSYHSIHKPGKEEWITASFKDTSLFENATITGRSGEKKEGFKGVGRKLNPTLSMTAVRERVQNILNTGVNFNSWFVDCDAAGEIFDDYSPNHITTQEEDVKARLKRMEYIANDKNMVVGSEGGNDYASQAIAFAHGIELPTFSWMDKDMSKNKNSEYYLGRYYSIDGGVPEKYSKQVPIKELYKQVFLNPVYSLPLYKLVYNDCVITSYHWDWSSLKIKDEVENRMMNEILYNVSPLYHIDKKEWNKNKDLILSHYKVWAPFHKKAVKKEMTDFKVLSKDRMVQMSEFGYDLKVVANFSNKDFKYENDVIKGKSLIIYSGDKKIKYKPCILQ
ncbi:glycoside hydrolase [Tepidibacter mesophilus]|uniref:glycoside hydrolase n=1 Tax=Tepidibacter mesophilus TaxID=655607 RepID=UPI000C08BC5D|nr:glycoside hydrolase [Tepidibacter mesophilus]